MGRRGSRARTPARPRCWSSARRRGIPHNVARGTFVEIDGKVQPAPAPRFSRTPAQVSRPAGEAGADRAEILADWGVDDERAGQ